MKLYGATVRLPCVGFQHVPVQADDIFRARAMLERQFARGNVTNVHIA